MTRGHDLFYTVYYIEPRPLSHGHDATAIWRDRLALVFRLRNDVIVVLRELLNIITDLHRRKGRRTLLELAPFFNLNSVTFSFIQSFNHICSPPPPAPRRLVTAAAQVKFSC